MNVQNGIVQNVKALIGKRPLQNAFAQMSTVVSHSNALWR